jgi:dTDP-4-amino-4,6-dideoxy-D-galactose acyltransferase
MSAEPAPCVHLPWDSEWFGRRIARVRGDALTAQGVKRVLAWAEGEDVDCLYCLIDADDAAGIRSAEDAGFRLVDTRVTLGRSVEEAFAAAAGEAAAQVEAAARGDLPHLKAIARVSHGSTRFYRDPNFPSERCDALYVRWIEHSCEGWADEVLVHREGGKALGYLSCHLEEDGWGRIGLFAMSPEARGRHLHRGLLEAALRWFALAGMRGVRVSTQAGNARALRTYERAGFLTTSVEHWYHRWQDGGQRVLLG